MPKETKQPLDHLRSQKKPVTRSVRIVTDDEIAEEYQRLQKAERAIERRMSSVEVPAQALIAEHDALVNELEAMEKRVRDNSILFKFRSIGRKKMEKLRDEHAPTEGQVKEFEASKEGIDDPNIKNAKMPFNPETYPRALIAKCLVEPEISEDEMLDWLNEDGTWNEAEIEAMFQACVEANTARRVVELGKG